MLSTAETGAFHVSNAIVISATTQQIIVELFTFNGTNAPDSNSFVAVLLGN